MFFLMVLFGVVASSVACGGGEGTLRLTVWGEEFIEEKIPAAEVEDGWEITFTKFLIVVGEVEIASKAGQKAADLKETKLFDLRKKGEQSLVDAKIPAGTWDALGYAVLPAKADTMAAEGIAEADLKMMKEQGYSVYFEGTATKGGEIKTFAWGFKTEARYKGCRSEKAVVQAGGTAKTQLTIHADHFFYDDLESEDAKVRFDALAAADKDGDGKITLEELAAVSGADFAALSSYGVGRFSQVTDLRAFVEHLSRTLGHIDGEGHCDVTL
jgi:hypothetical protein